MRMGTFEEYMSPFEWRMWKGERRMRMKECPDCGDSMICYYRGFSVVEKWKCNCGAIWWKMRKEREE